MTKLGILFCFAAASSLLGLSDQERRASFGAIVAAKEASIPQDTRTWFSQQTIQLDRFDKTAARLDHKKIISSLTKAEACFTPGKSVVEASDVLTPEQQYIVTRYPSNENSFWKLIIEAKVGTIVSLVTPSGDAYWCDNHFPKTVGADTITKISEQEMGTSPFFLQHKIIQRTFLITRQNGSSSTVQHFQYKNWPDHDAPEATLFRQFLQLIESHHTDGSVPILVHCAGGIGRSGTFVAAHSLRKQVRALRRPEGPHFVNIPKRILDLRMQRGRMLSHTTQLVAVIEAVRDAVFQSYLTQSASASPKLQATGHQIARDSSSQVYG